MTRVLDIGCGASGFGWRLARQRKIHYVGLDRDRDRIAESTARARRARHSASDLSYRHIREYPEYAAERFDVVTLFDVIEHVAPQRSLLAHIHRVLKSDRGRLIITCPKRHVFSVLDPGNFKCRFPRLHKTLTILVKSREYYHRRFVENPDGLIGDIEGETAWHQHFSEREMGDLLGQCGFEITKVDGMGLFSNFITCLSLATRCRWTRLRRFGERIFHQSQLLVGARKTPVGAAKNDQPPCA